MNLKLSNVTTLLMVFALPSIHLISASAPLLPGVRPAAPLDYWDVEVAFNRQCQDRSSGTAVLVRVFCSYLGGQIGGRKQFTSDNQYVTQVLAHAKLDRRLSSSKKLAYPELNSMAQRNGGVVIDSVGDGKHVRLQVGGAAKLCGLYLMKRFKHTKLMGLWCKATLASGHYHKITVKCAKGDIQQNPPKLDFAGFKETYVASRMLYKVLPPIKPAVATEIKAESSVSLTLEASGELFFEVEEGGDIIKIDFCGPFYDRNNIVFHLIVQTEYTEAPKSYTLETEFSPDRRFPT